MRDDTEKLDKILECIDRIQDYTKQGKDVVEGRLSPLREKIEDTDRRLVYKVPGEHHQPKSLEQKLKDKQEPKES